MDSTDKIPCFIKTSTKEQDTKGRKGPKRFRIDKGKEKERLELSTGYHYLSFPMQVTSTGRMDYVFVQPYSLNQHDPFWEWKEGLIKGV